MSTPAQTPLSNAKIFFAMDSSGSTMKAECKHKPKSVRHKGLVLILS